jgi:hypothetical protein
MALRLGKFELHQVRDGTFALDGGAMFGVVPKPFWQKRHPVDDRNRIELALRCLLIQEGNRRILVDAGIGSDWDEKRREIFAINPSDQGLDRELARAGCAREDRPSCSPESSCRPPKGTPSGCNSFASAAGIRPSFSAPT